MNKYQKAQEILDRVHYMYLRTDGTIEYPNSYDGDLLKIAYELAKKVLEDDTK